MSTIHDALTHAATAFDRKAADKAASNPRAHYNHYALGQYLMRIDDVVADIDAGASVEAAICAGFTPGALRNALLKAVGVKASNVEAHGSYKGMPVYQPASKR